MALIERLLAQANKESNELADLLLDSVDELSRLYKIESEWAALSQDDGKAEREIERLKAAPKPDLVAVVSGYYGGQCVVLPIDPARVFNAGTAFYTLSPASRHEPVQELVGYEHHEHRPFGAPGEVRISAILKSRYKLPDGSTSGDYQWIVDQCRASKDTIKLIPLYTTPQASNEIVSKPN